MERSFEKECREKRVDSRKVRSYMLKHHIPIDKAIEVYIENRNELKEQCSLLGINYKEAMDYQKYTGLTDEKVIKHMVKEQSIKREVMEECKKEGLSFNKVYSYMKQNKVSFEIAKEKYVKVNRALISKCLDIGLTKEEYRRVLYYRNKLGIDDNEAISYYIEYIQPLKKLSSELNVPLSTLMLYRENNTGCTIDEVINKFKPELPVNFLGEVIWDKRGTFEPSREYVKKSESSEVSVIDTMSIIEDTTKTISKRCEELGIKENLVKVYKHRHKCTTEEALEHYVIKSSANKEDETSLGLSGRCEELGISYGAVKVYKHRHKCTTEEAIVAVLKNKEAKDKRQDSLKRDIKDRCNKLGVSYDGVRIYAARNRISIEEAIEPYANSKERKDENKVEGRKSGKLKEECEKAGLSYRAVIHYKVNHNLTDYEVLKYFKDEVKPLQDKCNKLGINLKAAMTFKGKNPDYDDTTILKHFRPDLPVNMLGEIVWEEVEQSKQSKQNKH